MRILWITNILLPPLAKELNMPIPVVGGWMYSSLKNILKKDQGNQFAVATIWSGDSFKHLIIDKIDYYLLPLNHKSRNRYNPQLEKYWEKINSDYNPDVVHIHGSEFPHGLAFVNGCGGENTVVSIQGLVSQYANHYFGGIDIKNIIHNITPKDILMGGLIRGKKDFSKRGEYELELLRKVRNIIGRTPWDKAHAWAINSNADYFHVGETLRDPFYNHRWNYKNCIPYSIFVSQASYPIKGLHKLLEAMPIVCERFPQTTLYIAGPNIIDVPWYKESGYSKYLKKLIRKHGLSEKIIFTGPLDEDQICKRYLESNLFICCSCIENSPNSLGEAQMLGMPILASYVGGVPEIVNNDPGILYRYEETEMLAKMICDIFSQGERYRVPYTNLDRYNPSINTNELMACYKDIAMRNKQG